MNGRWFLKDDEEKFHSSDLILSSLFFLPPHLSLTLFFHISLEFEEIIKKRIFFSRWNENLLNESAEKVKSEVSLSSRMIYHLYY